MIKIDLIDRTLCEDCPNIDLETNTIIKEEEKTYNSQMLYGETKFICHSDTIITCKNKERCRSIMEYLEHASKTLP